MAWNDVENNKATDKQIKYAEKLLEDYYGDIVYPIYNMNKNEISKLISETKSMIEKKDNKKLGIKNSR